MNCWVFVKCEPKSSQLKEPKTLTTSVCVHWIYLIHELHNLSWITEINELFHDIVIYWDAPVYVISNTRNGNNIIPRIWGYGLVWTPDTKYSTCTMGIEIHSQILFIYICFWMFTGQVRVSSWRLWKAVFACCWSEGQGWDGYEQPQSVCLSLCGQTALTGWLDKTWNMKAHG